jgi:DNA polymerase-3 subunit delta
VDYAGFLRVADAGQPPPVTLLHGPEPFLLADAVARVARGLFPDGGELAFSREILEAREAGAEGIVRSALTLPFLSGRRLVVAKGVDALGARQGEPLAAYLKAPNPSTALLLLAEEELPAMHWLLKVVPSAAVVTTPRLVGRTLVGWLQTRARADGFEVGEEAAALLVDISGDDLTSLLGEVEKAALAGGPDNRRVTVECIRAVVGEHRLRHIFELTRALERRDRDAALSVLESLLNAGEDPLGVLGMLVRETRTAWQVTEWLRRGRAPEDIARRLRRPPAAAQSLVAHASGLAPATAVRRLVRCWEVERRLKLGGQARPELAVLIADLCAA